MNTPIQDPDPYGGHWRSRIGHHEYMNVAVRPHKRGEPDVALPRLEAHKPKALPTMPSLAPDALRQRPTLALRPDLISLRNLDKALSLARLCFELPFDQNQIVREYSKFVFGARNFEEPALKRSISIEADFVYMSQDQAVGIAGLYQYPSDPKRVWLSWFGVHPEHRGSGHGAAILGHIEECAKALGAESMLAYTEDCEPNEPCHRFYESLGYKSANRFKVGPDLMRVYELSI